MSARERRLLLFTFITAVFGAWPCLVAAQPGVSRQRRSRPSAAGALAVAQVGSVGSGGPAGRVSAG